ncbi:MAG: hypothetical protein ACHQPI_05010 [Thermoanaerobaculia bacterium]
MVSFFGAFLNLFFNWGLNVSYDQSGGITPIGSTSGGITPIGSTSGGITPIG